MRSNVFVSMSQGFSLQPIKFFQVCRFIVFLYYEAAKLAANVVKRFNTKNFTTRKKHKIGDYFFQKVEFVRPIPENASFHPLIINVLEKHAAS